MELIKQEALLELDKELDAEKPPMKTKDLFLLYAGLLVFILIFFYSYMNHPMELYQCFESPYLKPVILASPGIYGVYIGRKQKKQMEKDIKRLQKKWDSTFPTKNF